MGNMDVICVAIRGRMYRGEPRHIEESPAKGKTNCLTTVAKDNLIMQRPRGNNAGKIYIDKAPTMTANAWQENNLVMKSNTLCARARNDGNGQACIKTDGETPVIRRLTPTECARLQTIPDWYKWGVSETQQYKMLGNGWTVEVIKHILSFLPECLKKK